MMLLFDLGNSRLKWAQHEAGKKRHSGVMDAAAISAETLDKQFAKQQRPASIWISCVGSSAILQILSTWLEQRFMLPVSIARVSQSAAGIVNNYRDTTRLGVDRWLAAVGARTVFPAGDIIIIDAGTAVTIDWLSTHNKFEGGVIFPGAAVMHDALVGHTAQIESDYFDTSQIIGKTTRECVNSGVIYGTVGAVERIVEEMQKTICRPVKLVLTGGGADALAAKTELPVSYHQHLVLDGLLKIAMQDAAGSAIAGDR